MKEKTFQGGDLRPQDAFVFRVTTACPLDKMDPNVSVSDGVMRFFCFGLRPMPNNTALGVHCFVVALLAGKSGYPVVPYRKDLVDIVFPINVEATKVEEVKSMECFFVDEAAARSELEEMDASPWGFPASSAFLEVYQKFVSTLKQPHEGQE
jgi:hypothetical protein